jgi:hypothetical protein
MIFLPFTNDETLDKSIKPQPNPLEIDLSHFEIEDVIGQGGFGLVSIAKKLTFDDAGTKYAIKVR